MGKASESFKKRIAAATGPHGALSDFCRKTGLGRNTVERWIFEGVSPTLENLERAAEGMGMQAWELIKPEDAQATQPRFELWEAWAMLGQALEGSSRVPPKIATALAQELQSARN